MSRGRINVDVDLNGVHREIENAIEKGIKDSTGGGHTSPTDGSIPSRGIKSAKSKLRAEGAVWKEELINSFTFDRKPRSGGWKVTIENVSDHAAPMEFGAEYDNEGPPISELMPWVKSELQDWDVGEMWIGLAAVHLDTPYEDFDGSEDEWVSPDDFKSEMEDYGKAFWLQQKIKRQGLEPREFMQRMEQYLRQNASDIVGDNIDSALRSKL